MTTIYFDYDPYKEHFIGNIKTESRLDPADFLEINNFLRQKFYIFYNKTYKGYILKKKEAGKKIVSLELSGFKVELSESARKRVGSFLNHSQETVYFRKNYLEEKVIPVGCFLKEYQKEIVLYHLSRSNVLNTISAGLGKTAITVVSNSDHFIKNRIDGILCICINSHQYHWKHEFLTFSNLFKEDDFLLIDNSNKKDAFNPEKILNKKVIILPEHLLGDILNFYNSEQEDKNLSKIEWKSFIDLKKVWNKNNLALIVDEAHKFKNPETVKSMALESIINQFSFRTFLTATPSQNGFEHIYNLIHLLDKSIINKSYEYFKLDIAEHIGNRFDPLAINRYKEKEVSSYLDKFRKTIMIKVNKEDIPELKYKKTVEPLYLPIHPLQRKLYEQVCVLELQKIEEEKGEITYRDLQNKFHRVSYVLNNPFLLKDIANPEIVKLLTQWKKDYDPKFQALKYKIKDVIEEENSKLIVFANNPETLDFLEEEFKKYNPIKIHGKINKDSAELREQKRLNFMNPKHECKLALLSSFTSSAGGNWNVTNQMVVYEIPNDGIAWEQLINRTDRANSVKDSIITPLVIDKTIDSYFYEKNQNRVEFNKNLDKPLDLGTLRRLLNGNFKD